MRIGSKGHAKAELTVRRAPKNSPQGVHQPIELKNPVADRFQAYAEANLAARGDTEMCVSRVLALCGAGPSLRRANIKGADEVWACNSALPWMVENGIHVDVGVGIDQTPRLKEEWASPPDVLYYIATTCDPSLVEHLRAHGRRFKFFHNWTGFEGEREHYGAWPPGYIVGEGATVLNRMIGLADWMGFNRINVYGCDCAFGEDAEGNDLAHANGDTVTQAFGNPVIMAGEIDGVIWRSRPDMLRSAVELVRVARRSNGLIRLQAGTLPAALVDKDDAFLDEVMRTLKPGETPADLEVA